MVLWAATHGVSEKKATPPHSSQGEELTVLPVSYAFRSSVPCIMFLDESALLGLPREGLRSARVLVIFKCALLTMSGGLCALEVLRTGEHGLHILNTLIYVCMYSPFRKCFDSGIRDY